MTTTTPISAAKNTARVESRPATNDRQVTRLHNYASGELGGSVELTVSRERGEFMVAWNASRGRGWMRGWKKTFRGADAEKLAFTFVEEKWSALVTWLEKLEPVEAPGAAEAFSVQVASLYR